MAQRYKKINTRKILQVALAELADGKDYVDIPVTTISWYLKLFGGHNRLRPYNHISNNKLRARGT